MSTGRLRGSQPQLSLGRAQIRQEFHLQSIRGGCVGGGGLLPTWASQWAGFRGRCRPPDHGRRGAPTPEERGCVISL